MADSFGARVRELRIAAGMSMGELAGRISYSKSYLSKIENDLKPPTATVAKLCDSALGAGGELIALTQQSSASLAIDEAADDEVWVMALDGDGDLRFNLVDRRQVLAGAGVLLGFALTRGARPAVDPAVISGLRVSFDSYRWLGVQTSPAAVLPQVITHIHTLRMLAADCPESETRAELLLQAARAAEFAGWMSQEAGDERGALWWTRRAVSFAEAGRDRPLASYTLVRQAEIALYRQDAISTIDLAKRAQTNRNAGPRVLGLAAQSEAQGHALAGDVDAFERALDRAATLLAMADPDVGKNPVLGSSTVPDPISLTRGWALSDLGRPELAAAVLDRHMAQIPATARRPRARFGARRALAHALNGEIDQACVVLAEVLDDAAQVDSATVRVDLRQLARTLARWHNHGAVRNVYPELTGVLRAPQPAG